jgi:ligand-binding sensor domain-containing protein
MRILLVIALIVLNAYCFGQQAKQYAFRHFSVSNGLASNTVYDIKQDKDGYIWMATTNGLQRYDGHAFLTFSSNEGNPEAIPNNSIVYMYYDRKGQLWIMSDDNNFGIFDTKKFTYHKAFIEKDDAKIFLPQHFVELPTGEMILIKNNRGMYRYDERKHQFIRANNIFPIPAGWQVNEIAWDYKKQKYWMSCDSGIVQYDPVSKHVNYRGHNTDNDPVIAANARLTGPTGLKVDSVGNIFTVIWAKGAAAPLIVRYSLKTKKLDSLGINIGYHELLGTLQQRNGRLWVYGMPFFAEWTDASGPFQLIPNEYRSEQSMKFDYALSAFEDRESNIWISSDNGVFLFNPDEQIFNTYNLVRTGEQPQEGPVQAMEETPDGKIFVGCWGKGLFCFDKNFHPLPIPSVFKPKYTYMSIWDMAVHSRSGKLWITQQNGYLDIYDTKTNKLLSFSPPVFGGSTIRQIDEDTSGNFWFGTQSGKLVKWDYRKSGGDPTKGYELIYQTGRILKVHFDYAGYIWLATLGSGLIKIDVHTNKVVHIFTTSGPKGQRLYMDSPGDMTYFDDSTLLVSAQCINIINTKTNQVSYFKAEDGLPSNTTESIQRDKNGIVWIGMTNGLCRLNLKKKLISYYDRRDGIAYDRFPMAGVTQLSGGNMVFYTDHNFLVFDPKKIAEAEVPPRPYITSFKLAGEPLSWDSLNRSKKIALKYNSTSIAIDFSALSYLQQRKVHYFYMLENLDEGWIHTDHPVEAIYNYLPPGEYIFKVKSENVDGLTSQTIAAIPIVVRAPFWQTWWFFSMMALLVIAILYLLDRERMNKQNSLRQIRSQIRSNLRNEVASTLNNITVLSEIAKIKADKNVEQAKDFIDQISEKSQHMAEALDDTLWSIDPTNDSMKKTLLRIKELTEGLRIANNIDVDLIVDNKVEELALDMRVRHDLFFFYKEALHFIVLNICCNQVFVNFNKVKGKLLIEMLSDCSCDTRTISEKFSEAVQARVKALPATMEVIVDSRSFAAVLNVDVK